MSRPQKYVATSFLLSTTDPWSQLPFLCYDLNCLSVHYLVATWDLGRDIDWCPQLTFLSQHQFWFATNYVFFLRRDLEAVSRHEGWLFLSMLLS